MPRLSEPWIFWDMDGTLIDSVPALYHVYRDFLQKRGRSGSRREFNRLNGPALHEVVDFLKKKHRLSESKKALIRQYQNLIRDAYKSTARVKPDVVHVLSQFKRAGFRQMLVTSSSSGLAVPCLKRNRIASYFDSMVFGDEVKQSKPSPDIYRKALVRAKVRPAFAVVIEDSKNGMLSARGAGIPAIRVSNRSGHLKTISDAIVSRRLMTLTSWSLNPSKKIKIHVRGKATRSEHLFCVDKVNFTEGAPTITGSFVPYARYRRENHRYASLAVSGLVIAAQNGKDHYLWGVRSSKVFHYKRCWELVPSGGVDTSCVLPGKKLDLSKMLMSELEEESGIKRSHITSVSPSQLIWDPKVRVWDVCMTVRVKPGAHKTLKWNAREHAKMGFYSKEQVRRAVLRKGSRVVPTSALLWNTI